MNIETRLNQVMFWLYISPVDGQWSDWSSWGTCDVTCGGGTQIRARTCSNPLAQFGGKPCENATQAFIEQQTCNEQNCPGRYLY